MGLATSAIRFLIRDHQRAPFSGPILTLGRQHVSASRQTFISIFEAEGLTPDQSARSGPPTDREFFRLLGNFDVFALDLLAEENPDYIWDLNRPIPDDLRGRFGTVIDGGTIEHVFDVRTALSNVTDLLRVGGRVMHISPGSNYLEHGFYQFSATLSSDYYQANQFDDIRCYLVEHDIERDDSGRTDWDIWTWNPKRPYSRVQSNRQIAILCTATKSAASTSNAIPLQGFYQRLLSNDDGVPMKSSANAQVARALARGLRINGAGFSNARSGETTVEIRGDSKSSGGIDRRMSRRSASFNSAGVSRTRLAIWQTSEVQPQHFAPALMSDHRTRSPSRSVASVRAL